MHPHLIIIISGYYLTSFLSFIIGVFVYFRGGKKTITNIFALFALAVSLWSLAFALHVSSDSFLEVSFFSRIADLIGIWIGVFYFHFIVVFLNKNKGEKRIIQFIYLIAGMIVALALLFPQYWVGEPEPKLYFDYYGSNVGYIYYFYTFFLLSLFLYSFCLLFKSYKALDAIKRNRAKYIIFGSAPWMILGSFNFFIVYDIKIDPVLSSFSGFFPLIFAYAILKHQLLDIRVVIIRGAIQAVLISVLIGLLVSLASLNEWLLGAFNFYRPWMMMLAGGLFAFFFGRYFLAKNRQLRYEEGKVRAMIDSLVDGLLIFDKEMRISLINPAAERILQVKKKDILGEKIDQMAKYPAVDKLYTALGESVEQIGRKYELVFEGIKKRFFHIVITPVEIAQETVGMMVALHDITRSKEIERMKSEFVSVAAHQLRTPLSAVKWVIKSILDGDTGEVSPEQAELLEKGYKSNERMITLVNALLNIARIEEGRVVSDFTITSIERIIEGAVSSLDKLARDKKTRIIFQRPKTSLPKIKADIEKISLAVQSILDNAIRYNLVGGEVVVSAEKYDSKNIKVAVKDSGIGIPKSQQERIFSKFFRGDNAVKAETEGSGLGLFISKNIIESHGGKIWFESRTGEGTTFQFILPIRPIEKDNLE